MKNVRYIAYIRSLFAMLKSRLHFQALLVFVDMKSQNEKPKEPEIKEEIHEHQ